MRTAWELAELCAEIGPFTTPGEFQGEPLDEGVFWPTLRTTIVWAGEVVDELFDDDPEQPAFKARITFDFRARQLGPEVAAGDLERAKAQGWWRKVWDEDGVLMDPKPLRGG